jgi:NAD(P)-dependent dehydrogenase (short-subunit alcohol dehydrogenase family)
MLLNYEFSANLIKTAATALSDAANPRGEACRDWANGSVMIDLAGQRIVVTGAAGGIGTAMVEVLTGFGAMVVACDIDGADLALPGVAEAHHFDLMDDAAIEAAAAAICAGGVPNAVISNAGWTRAETLADVSADALSHELDLNLRSAARLSQAFLPDMRKNGGGAFVFISSVNALSHYGNPAYAAAKAGLLAWMRAIATEEGRNGIRANAIAPGSVRTMAWDHRIERDPAILGKVKQLYPLGRMVEPAEVARAAAFLVSPLASGITGTVLPVDAGISAGNLPFLEQIAV